MPAVQQCAERVAMHTAGGREPLLAYWAGLVTWGSTQTQLSQHLPQFLQWSLKLTASVIEVPYNRSPLATAEPRAGLMRETLRSIMDSQCAHGFWKGCSSPVFVYTHPPSQLSSWLTQRTSDSRLNITGARSPIDSHQLSQEPRQDAHILYSVSLTVVLPLTEFWVMWNYILMTFRKSYNHLNLALVGWKGG